MGKPERSFHLGDVLSVTTGCFLAPSGIGALYDLLGYMTGESIYTHQLPRAGRECAPELLRQYPELSAVDASGVTRENWRAWLDEQVARFGETLAVKPLPSREAQYDTPIADLIEMVGDPTKVMVLDVSEDAPDGD